MSIHGSSGGGLGSLLEKSLIVDILTISVLAFNFYLLQAQMGFGDSLLSVSTDPYTIAAQLTVVLIVVYILEMIVDKAGGAH